MRNFLYVVALALRPSVDPRSSKHPSRQLFTPGALGGLSAARLVMLYIYIYIYTYICRAMWTNIMLKRTRSKRCSFPLRFPYDDVPNIIYNIIYNAVIISYINITSHAADRPPRAPGVKS